MRLALGRTKDEDFNALVAAIDSMAMLAGLVLLEVLSIGLFASASAFGSRPHAVHERMLHRLAHQATSMALQATEALRAAAAWLGGPLCAA